MDASVLERIQSCIKTIPDYPKPGILFRDITSLLQDDQAFSLSLDALAEPFLNKGITKVAGTEARGFIFGACLAQKLGVGFIPVRKANKLPRDVVGQDYELEYGTDRLEIHTDAVGKNDQVLIVDDLLATGGTVKATAELIAQLGANVHAAAFVISLPDLGGETVMEEADIETFSLFRYTGE
ncbi:adenine phosphoribosyltransferase [Catenovulum sp. SM1970]|uniref:adenine phosphoribosyltransferase n=1 Tax=Marinifaba aquimaris TaxID=2741323 RepID=UPI0015724BDA|nr:adenine phosphoribosyltransferase [Marinifaba aquimaris]NTS75258.1 adenine phosphoribosyltransferase [Marinifaba aquimaris]